MSEKLAASADFSLRILWSLARWIEDTKGRDELTKVAVAAGVRPEDFDGSTRWVSHAQFETILELARELAGSEETFMAAGAHRFSESYGAFRFMVWGLSQQQLYDAAAKYQRVVTKVGRIEVLVSERTRFHARYYSERPESRRMCLLRQVGWTIGPTTWGLPPTQLEERACMAQGDAYCEYHLRWLERTNIVPPLAGAVAGGAAALGLMAMQAPGLPALVVLPFVGAILGLILEFRRAGKANLAYARDVHQVVDDLGHAEAETRSEIFALNQRQRDWIRLMEEQVTDRTRTLEQIVGGLDSLQQTRVTSIRGFSHDLRNPLFVVRGNTQFLREKFTEGEEAEALGDMEVAATQIEVMLTKLMEVATHELGFVKLAPKPVAVAPLADIFRRRLRALVHARDIKVTVFCTREAPESIVIDPLVFDRVVDNLLTNASKYTHRGSILLEVSGTPGGQPGDAAESYLTLKLSDTGEGIPADKLARVFRPRPAGEPTSAKSYGIGLSSVVRLLAQIGGRLDVMSKADVGTTFWAHFPVVVPAEKKGTDANEDNLESMITRVVTIRKAEGA
jgi:signal transduction histidine kinase